MELTQDLVIYLLGLAAMAGTILARLSSLEKKVDKHNNLVERTYELEEQAAIHEEKIKVANHRIDDLLTEIK